MATAGQAKVRGQVMADTVVGIYGRSPLSTSIFSLRKEARLSAEIDEGRRVVGD